MNLVYSWRLKPLHVIKLTSLEGQLSFLSCSCIPSTNLSLQIVCHQAPWQTIQMQRWIRHDPWLQRPVMWRGTQTPCQTGVHGTCPEWAGHQGCCWMGGCGNTTQWYHCILSGAGVFGRGTGGRESTPRPEWVMGHVRKGGEPMCCSSRELRAEARPPHLFPCSEPWFNQWRKPQGPDADAGEWGAFKLRKMSFQIRG